MANFSDGDENDFSLFPVLGILVGTLGVMVFLLAAVSALSAVSMGGDNALRFRVDPGPSESQQEPVPTWAEWDGRRLALLPGGEAAVFPRDLATIETFEETYDYMSERLSGTSVGDELAEIAVDPQRYVALLVRPQGLASLAEVRGYLDRLGARHLAEPVGADIRRIDVG